MEQEAFKGWVHPGVAQGHPQPSTFLASKTPSFCPSSGTSCVTVSSSRNEGSEACDSLLSSAEVTYAFLCSFVKSYWGLSSRARCQVRPEGALSSGGSQPTCGDETTPRANDTAETVARCWSCCDCSGPTDKEEGLAFSLGDDMIVTVS